MEAHARVNAAINDKVDRMCRAGELSGEQGELMRQWASQRDWRNWQDDQAREFGRHVGRLSEWRRSLLGIERSVIVSMRNDGELSEQVLRQMQHELDLEDALLERRSADVDGHLNELPTEAGDEPPDGSPDGAGPPDNGTGGAEGMTVSDENGHDSRDTSALLPDERHLSTPERRPPKSG